MRKLLLLLAVGLVLAADKPKGDAKKIEGTWEIISAEKDGNPLDDFKGAETIFKEGKVTYSDGNGEHVAEYKLDSTKKPRQIDFTPKDGAQEGKLLRGIYTLEGGQLKMCIAVNPDKDRPTEFATQDGSDLVLIVLKPKKS